MKLILLCAVVVILAVIALVIFWKGDE